MLYLVLSDLQYMNESLLHAGVNASFPHSWMTISTADIITTTLNYLQCNPSIVNVLQACIYLRYSWNVLLSHIFSSGRASALSSLLV